MCAGESRELYAGVLEHPEIESSKRTYAALSLLAGFKKARRQHMDEDGNQVAEIRRRQDYRPVPVCPAFLAVQIEDGQSSRNKGITERISQFEVRVEKPMPFAIRSISAAQRKHLLVK